MKVYWMIALIISSACMVGCEYVLPVQPILGYENSDEACSDGRDNDEDGLVDCDDADCVFSSSQCGEDVPLIPNLEPEAGLTCHDQIDNDDNGQFDCGDRACSSVLRTVAQESSAMRHAPMASITMAMAMWIARTSGVEMTLSALSPYAITTVRAGRIVSQRAVVPRLRSPSAVMVSTTTAMAIPTATISVARGQIRPRFLNTAMWQGEPEDTLEACQDGIDNDNNGYVDCNDFSCSKNPNPAIAELCIPDEPVIPEDTPEMCSDGIDNDGDGYTDCSDNSCRNSDSLAVRKVCQESLPQAVVANCDDDDPFDADCYEAVLAACSDGQDNDGDSYVDCEDFDCSHHPLGVCQGAKVCEDI